MARINKKELYNYVESLIDGMDKDKSFNEGILSKFLTIDKNVDEMILKSSPSDFFKYHKIEQIHKNLKDEFDVDTIKNLVNNEHSWKVAINMKDARAWIMERNSYDQNKDVEYFSFPSLKDYEYDTLSEIKIALKDGFSPLIDDDDRFYLQDELEDAFDVLREDREYREQKIENDDNEIEFDR